MKVAVYGAGAVGAYFGGRLAEAGTEVSFIARGAHLEAMREGAFHYLPKPFKNEEVCITLRKGLERRHLTIENRRLRERLDHRLGDPSRALV